MFMLLKRRCTPVNSHVNISKSDNFNTSNSNNVIGNSNFLRINVQNEISLNQLITFQKETGTESIVSINDEIIDENNISEEMSYRQNSVEVIDHTCDDNVNHLINAEEEAFVTSIHSINVTNYIYMNNDDNFIHKYYAPFFCQRTMKIYLQEHNMIQRNGQFVVRKKLFWFYY